MQLKDLPVGTKIKFGNYQIENETPQALIWQIADFNHKESSDIVWNNLCTLITQEAIDFRNIDTIEPENLFYSKYFSKKGNCKYSISNIDQWLNSDKAGGEWYIPQHEYDEPPTEEMILLYNDQAKFSCEYFNKPGFLSYFSEKEKELIKEVTIKNTEVIYSTNPNGKPSFENITFKRKVFLPSRTEVGALSSEIDFCLKIFSASNESRMRKMTSQCFNNSQSLQAKKYGGTDGNNNIYYYLRTNGFAYSNPYLFNVSHLGKVSNSNTIEFSSPVEERGILPIINLPDDTELNEQLDMDGCYSIKFNNNVPQETKKYISYKKIKKI